MKWIEAITAVLAKEGRPMHIDDIFKMILLIVIGGAFLGLSIFSDQKLKIEKTTKTYWLVGMSFLFFAFLSIGYFGLLGETFKFGGVEEDLFVGSLLIFTSLLTFVTYYKFKNDLYFRSWTWWSSDDC